MAECDLATFLGSCDLSADEDIGFTLNEDEILGHSTVSKNKNSTENKSSEDIKYSGKSTVTFGKHKNKTYEKVLEDQNYCEWIISSSFEPKYNTSASLKKWIKKNYVKKAYSGEKNTLVGFGKHKNRTYEELMTLFPKYCVWITSPKFTPTYGKALSLKIFLKDNM
uniref:Uncharacterized protein n=1 Tax=Pithovirus LCDPAC01 TaxID=2506600 RepID=A0A481YMW8_9VIRU|nr:MAG: hypothetical protein LCDPAC01_01710 [Pithovirus LCDPAC01]